MKAGMAGLENEPGESSSLLLVACVSDQNNRII
jgi:hypothetical protein